MLKGIKVKKGEIESVENVEEERKKREETEKDEGRESGEKDWSGCGYEEIRRERKEGSDRNEKRYHHNKHQASDRYRGHKKNHSHQDHRNHQSGWRSKEYKKREASPQFLPKHIGETQRKPPYRPQTSELAPQDINTLCSDAIEMLCSGDMTGYQNELNYLANMSRRQHIVWIDHDAEDHIQSLEERVREEEDKEREQNSPNMEDELPLEGNYEREKCNDYFDKEPVERAALEGDRVESSFQELMREKQRGILHKRDKYEQGTLGVEVENDNNFDSLLHKKIKSGWEQKRKRKEQKFALKQFRKTSKILANCKLCFENQLIIYSQVLSESEHIYVTHALQCHLTKFHCWIIPKEHTFSLSSMEEGPYTELRNYIKSLIAFYKSIGKVGVFIETVTDITNSPHTVIESIPIDENLCEEVKMCFKQELEKVDSTWSQHKKIIDTTERKGNISKILPQNFNYFHVDFEGLGGFAHVIENKAKFPRTFGREVIGSLLDVDQTDILYPRAVTLEESTIEVKEFGAKFAYYDWNSYIKTSNQLNVDMHILTEIDVS